MDPFEKLIDLMRILVIAGLVLLVVAFTIRIFLQKKGVVFGDKKRHIKVKETIKGEGLTVGENPDGFIFGLKNGKKVYMDRKEEGHICVFGAPGEGKTSALLIPSLCAWQGPAFCIDISGDIHPNISGDKLIFSPDDPENSMNYDVFYAVDNASDPDAAQVQIELIVNLMIPISPNENSADQYFKRTARKMLLAAMTAYYWQEDADFIPICQKAFFLNYRALFEMVIAQNNKLATAYVNSIKDEKAENLAGAKSALDQHIKLFATSKGVSAIMHRSLTGERSITPRDLEDHRIFLVVPDSKQEYYNSCCSLITGQMMSYMSNRLYVKEKMNRVLLALDEFASLGHFEIIGPMRKIRKNGGNVCIITQSLADLDLVYSKDERRVIMDNAFFVVVLSARDNDSRTYFSELVGKEDVQQQSTTSSSAGNSSATTSYTQQYVIHPNEWKSLGDNLVVIHKNGYCKLKKNFYFKEK